MAEDAAAFLAGVAFPGTEAVSYPRALAGDAARLPADTWAAACIPVGVRLELVGDAEAVAIEYETTTGDLGYRGAGAGTTFASWRGEVLVDEVPAVLGAGRAVLKLRADGEAEAGGRVVVTLPEGMRPVLRTVEGVGGTVHPAPPQPRWLCYGDSIAEGWIATAPGRAWPAVAGRRYGLDVVNLGYAGAARGEMVSAEEIADLPADVISLSHGTNCWERIPHGAAQLAAGLAAFLALVRTGHPTTPVVVASPVLRPDAEDRPNRLGATLADLRVAMEAAVVELMASDPALTLVPGGGLLVAGQLGDGIHPDDDGHRVLAGAIGGPVARAVRAIGGPVARAVEGR